jgi:hypothetical protein
MVLAPAALAQDASPEAAPIETLGVDVEPPGPPSQLCSVLTDAEVSAALGVTLQVADSTDYDCSWYADFVTTDLGILVTRDTGDFELDAQESFPEGVAVEIAGLQGWYTADVPLVLVDIGDGLLFTIELSGTPGDDLDVQAALTGLAELAVPRLAAVPVPSEEPVPTEEPVPSPEGDPILSGLIPTMVGDAEMFVDVYSANDLFSTLDPDSPDTQTSIEALSGLVEAHGKTVDDVSFADAYFDTGAAYGGLFAVRVAGADVAGFQDELFDVIIGLSDPQRSPATIAGRELTVVTEGPAATGSPAASPDPDALPPSYVYAAGDVLYVVSADEPQLTQLFELLPRP